MADRYLALIDEISREFPGFRVVKKHESRFQRAIGGVLRALTFGGQSAYLTSYQTTIGRTVYVTPDWDERDPDERYITMRHELVHLRQFRRYTLPGMALLYLLVPLPVGLAWFRAYFEKQGYAETVRAAAEVHGSDYVSQPAYREYVVGQFLTGAYGWMWPFRGSLERWYDQILSEIRRDRL